MKNSTVAFIAALTLASASILHVANAQEAPAPAPPQPLATDFCNNLKDIPKAKGVMLMALRDPNGSRTIEIPYSTARACEEERCRIKATIAAQCIWVK